MASIKNAGQTVVVGTNTDDYFVDFSASGAQTMIGGLGNDTYEVDSATDLLVENKGKVEGIDTAIISTAVTYDMSLYATDVENLTLIGAVTSGGTYTGNALDNHIDGSAASVKLKLLGGAGNDTIESGAGSFNDTLNGGTGVDSMIGHLGNDEYHVDNTGDKVIESLNEGTDTVFAAVNYTLSANVEKLNLTGVNDSTTDTANINGTGNALDNTIAGNYGNNLLTGADGNDSMSGSNGNDKLLGGNGNDTLSGGADNDSVDGGAGDDSLTGGTGNDTLTGGAGSDSLIGGTGTTKFDGGAGDDFLNSSGYKDTLLGGIGNDFITLLGGNKESVDAGAGDDIIVLRGGASDVGFGNTTIAGGAGNDTYYLQAAASLTKLTLNDSAGIDTIRLIDSGSSVASLVDSTWPAGQSSVASDTGFALNKYTLATGIENLIADMSVNAKYLVGNTLDNLIVGTSGNDVLQGLAGNDTLDGGSGADNLAGGIGNDTYVVDQAADTVYEASNAGIDTVWAYGTYQLTANVENLTLFGTGNFLGTGNDLGNTIIGNSGNNTLDGGAGNDSLQGGAGADVVYAGNGNDTIDGGAGTDSLYGGLGNDTYYVDATADVVIDVKGGGTDTVVSTATNYTLGFNNNVENLTLAGTAFKGVGNALNNTITGTDNNNQLEDGNVYNSGSTISNGSGGGGLDTLIGGKGDDTYYALWDTSGQDVITDVSGNDTLNLYVESTALNSNITLDSGILSSIENLNILGVYTAAGSFNGFTLTGGAASNIISGSNLNDSIIGGAGNDTLSGGNDILNDTLDGGAGNDYFFYNTYDTYIEAATGGIDTIAVTDLNLSLANIASGNIENMDITVDNAAYSFAGTAANNQFTLMQNFNGATAYSVTIDGGLGNDSYIVGDIYGEFNGDVTAVDGTFVSIADSGASGTDTVTAYVDGVTLGIGVENLVLGTRITNDGLATVTGYALTGTGNSLANTIIGNAGNNTIDGGAGSDTMTGGAGDDTYWVDDVTLNAGDKVIEAFDGGTDQVYFNSTHAGDSYTLAANVENGTTTQSGLKLIGNTLDNTLYGNGSGNETLDGGLGNDTLDGYAGADSLIGGAGNDTFNNVDSTDIVDEAINGGIDTVITQNALTTYTLAANVENLLYTAGSVATMTGNALDNNIFYTGSFFGADTIDGGVGADTMDGGNGGDTYIVDNTNDLILDSGASGTDAITASGISSFNMVTNAWEVENFTLTGSLATAADITGNELANTIDTTAYTGAAANVFSGGGNDTLIGGNIGSTLSGGAGADSITGGNGADTLIGGDGSDVLTGGNGSDVFVFTSLELGTPDTITDFVTGTDQFELDPTIFTSLTSLGSITASEFISGAGVTAATTASQYLIYNTTTGFLYYDADGTGSTAKVQIATLGVGSHPAIAATDFIFDAS